MRVEPHPDDASQAAEVVLREREARDRCWWDAMAKCFHVDSHVEISWFHGSGAEFVAASVGMAARGVTSRHRLGPPTVRAREGRAVVLLPAVVETYPLIDDVECVLNAYCRLCYRVRNDDGDWTIAGMQVVYERDELHAALPGPSVTVPATDVAGLRVPYRLLAWTLRQSGFAISQDLPADDRPELVTALYSEAYAWAGIPWPPTE
jgi:hypothetical protein